MRLVVQLCFVYVGRLSITSAASVVEEGDQSNMALFKCLPAKLGLEGGKILNVLSGAPNRMEGTGAFIFPIEDYAVKVGKVLSTAMVKEIKRELGVLQALDGLGGHAGRSYDFKFSETPKHNKCASVIYVTDYVQGHDLSAFLPMTDGKLRAPKEPMLARIAVKLIHILREIHNKGYVHGDVHGGNFLFKDDSEDADLVVIDFGRSAKFDTESVKGTLRILPTNLYRRAFSIYELDLKAPAPRDDMYRLSEMFLRILGKEIEGIKPGAEGDVSGSLTDADVIKQKKAMSDSSTGNWPVWNEFHKAMSELEATDKIDYDGWIKRFEALAQWNAVMTELRAKAQAQTGPKSRLSPNEASSGMELANISPEKSSLKVVNPMRQQTPEISGVSSESRSATIGAGMSAFGLLVLVLLGC